MTTVQTMFACAGRRGLRLLICLAAAATASCAPRHDVLVPPEVLVAPYDASHGDVLWAVVPPVNESGISIVQTDRIGDALAAKIDETRGLSCLPSCSHPSRPARWPTPSGWTA